MKKAKKSKGQTFRQSLFLTNIKKEGKLVTTESKIFCLCFISLSLAFLSFPLLSLAATLLGRQAPLGDITHSFTARQAGMGGARIASTSDATALFFSPARLSTVNSKFNLVAVPSLYSVYEKATHADSAKSFDENSITYLDFPLFAASYTFENLTLAAGWGAFFDFRYLFDSQTFFQGSLSRHKREEDFGQIRALVGSASYRLSKFSLGLSYLAYRGTPSFSYSDLTFAQSGDGLVSSSVRQIDKVFGGRQVMGGISYAHNEKLAVAAAINGRFTMSETETKIENEVRSHIARDWKMPWELAMGATYKFSEKGTQPMLAFDLIKSWWGKSEVSTDGGTFQSAGLVDTLSYHIGMEHSIKSNIPLRYGASRIPFYGRESADAFTVSIGSGYHWIWGAHRISFEISGEYAIRSSAKTARLFPEPEDASLPFINQDVVNSYIKRVVATISYKF